jgi:Helix-turn-helix domain
MSNDEDVIGYGVAPNWLIRSRTIPLHVKMMFVYLSGRIGGTPGGTCYPSQATIAADLCISVSTVKRTLRDMQERKMLEVVVRRDGVGRHNVYRLTHDPYGGAPHRGVGSQ